MITKGNAVVGFPFHLVSKTTGDDVNSGSPVGYYVGDDGSQTAITDTTPTSKGNGIWTADLTAAETNFDVLSLAFVLSGSITASFTIPTIVVAPSAVRTDIPITPGRLSLYQGEARLGVVRTKLSWDFTDLSGVTDFTTGSTGSLVFTEKYCDQSTVGTMSLDSVTDQGSNVYRAIFTVSAAVADAFLIGTRMTFRATLAHAASGADFVLDAGDVVVS